MKDKANYEREWLVRLDEAGDWGIERRLIPARILQALQMAGYVTAIEATPRITEAGRRALSGQTEKQGGEADG